MIPGIASVLRQLLLSLVMLIVGAAAYLYFVPNSVETLASVGFALPPAVTGILRSENGPEGTAAPLVPGSAGGEGRPNRAPNPGGGRQGMPAVVVTMPVGSAIINDHLRAMGEGEAIRSVTVMSPGTGILVELLVDQGEIVSRGDVIGRLDAENEEIAAERARLALEDARATLARTEALAQSNAATTVQLDTARLAAQNAELELRTAELALEQRAIRSPIDGRVGLFQVGLGNTLTAQTEVTTVQETSEIVINFWVPERYAASIHPGDTVSVRAVALPGRDFEGQVTAIDNRVDSASRTLQVQAHIPNESDDIRPGMSFSVEMSFPGAEYAAVDPLAIQWSGEGAYVWAYVDGTVSRRFVEIIQRNSNGVLVQGALQPGEVVVTQGVQQLREGAPVRLLEEPQVAAAPAPSNDPIVLDVPVRSEQTADAVPKLQAPASSGIEWAELLPFQPPSPRPRPDRTSLTEAQPS